MSFCVFCHCHKEWNVAAVEERAVVRWFPHLLQLIPSIPELFLGFVLLFEAITQRVDPKYKTCEAKLPISYPARIFSAFSVSPMFSLFLAVCCHKNITFWYCERHGRKRATVQYIAPRTRRYIVRILSKFTPPAEQRKCSFAQISSAENNSDPIWF